MDKEEKINKFLQGFFNYNYPRKKSYLKIYQVFIYLCHF